MDGVDGVDGVDTEMDTDGHGRTRTPRTEMGEVDGVDGVDVRMDALASAQAQDGTGKTEG